MKSKHNRDRKHIRCYTQGLCIIGVWLSSSVVGASAIEATQLREKICPAEHFCTLTRMTEIGRDSRGHRVFVVVNDETPQGDSTAEYSGCWRSEWWRVTFDGKILREAKRIVTERENYGSLGIGANRGDGPCWYGAGGGQENVTLQGDVLTYSVEGGTGWRWNQSTTWRLLPELTELTKVNSQWWRMNPAYGHTITHDYDTRTARDELGYTVCVKEPSGSYLGSTAVSDRIPVIDSSKHPQFDWQHSEWPVKLRVRADGKRAIDTAGFVITKTEPRRHTDGSLASITTAVIDNQEVLIEVDDPHIVTGSASWVNDSHIELWLWPGGADASYPCLLPTWDNALMQRVSAEDVRAAEQATPEAPSDGPIKPRPFYQWGIRTADAKIFNGFGKPAPNSLALKQIKLDNRRTRFLITLPALGPMTVVYSTRSVDGKQHLFATSRLRYGDPTSLGALPYDHDVAARQQKSQAAEQAIIAKASPQLLDAIERGEVQVVSKLIGDHPGLANATLDGGFTVLMSAVAHGQIDIAVHLLDAGAKLHAVTTEGMTALHYAVGAKAPVKFRPLSPTPPLQLVSTDLDQLAPEKRPLLAMLLIARGADANARNNEGETPLLVAAAEASGTAVDVELIKHLLEHRADIRASDNEGFTALHRSLAAEQLQIELVLFLVAHTPQPARATHYGVTATMLAAGNTDVAALKAVLDRAPETLQAKNQDGSTALHYAVAAGQVDNVKLLLARGANPRLANRKGETPLRLAQLQGFAEIEALLKTATGK